MRLPVAKEGVPFILSGVILSGIFYLFNLRVLASILALLSIFIVWFFRDPNRAVPSESGAVLTPADGKVMVIKEVEAQESPIGIPAKLVSIFMSIFNVHVNRMPVSGRIVDIKYSPGRFIPANKEDASRKNEQNMITLETDNGSKVAVVQVAGLIARRIVCWVRKGEVLRAGDRFGLIRFGSRVDLYLPYKSRIIVNKNDRVKAGETIIGFIQ